MRQSNETAYKADSTALSDPRITRIGLTLRQTKMDEIPQLINILAGDMSFVGPRPNVPREVKLYTNIERSLLNRRPGLTDLASIVFCDLAEILNGSKEPDVAYKEQVRPWKSALGIEYIRLESYLLDIKIVFLTAVALLRPEIAWKRIENILRQNGAPEDLTTYIKTKRRGNAK